MQENMFEKQPFLTIVIPVYNTYDYLDRCLESIIKQYNNGNIELLCINDGSTDNSLTKLISYASQYNFIKIIDSKHQGVSYSRNLGIRMAKGEFIWFVDSDDAIADFAVSNIFLSINQIADVNIFGAKVINSSQEGFLLNDIIPPKKTYEGNCLKAFYEEESCKPYIWNTIYKKAFLHSKIILFDENLTIGEDIAFQFSVLCAANDVIFNEQIIYIHYYLQSAESSMRKIIHTPIKRLEHCSEVVKSILSNCKVKRNSKDFAKWVYIYLLKEVYTLPIRERNFLLLKISKSVFQKHHLCFSGLPARTKLKCFCLNNIILFKIWLFFRNFKES